jgi:RNA methyltransferase, TrmH family
MSSVNQWRRYHKDAEHSYSFGVFPTLELLTHRPDRALQVVAHSKGARGSGLSKLEALCARHQVPFTYHDRAVERLSHKGNIYVFGVFAKYRAPLSSTANHLLLVHPSDNGNLGTIGRTLLAFGQRDLALLEPAVDLFNPHVVRASMGATFALNFGYFENLEAYREAFAHRLYPFMLGASAVLGAVEFRSPYTLVFGPEGPGLPPEYAGVGDPVMIPQSPLVESLNLAVAVAVALYEGNRGAEVLARPAN